MTARKRTGAARRGFGVRRRLGALLLGAASAASAAERVALPLSAKPDGEGLEALECPATLPGHVDAHLRAPPEQWRAFRALEFHVAWPADAPADAQALVFMKDWDNYWFQWLAPQRLRPGATNRFVADLSPGAPGWEPVGHYGAWQFRTRMAPREFGIRVFGDSAWSGTFRIERAAGIEAAPDESAPFLRDVRPAATRVPVFGRFEVQFALPDRYANPFDPDEIAVRAVFERPDGVEETVDGFFAQEYFRRLMPAGERYVPQGPPAWKVRYAPRVPGVHRYRLFARDARGEAQWGPGEFEARPSDRPGFARVSKTDPRYFEFETGGYFYPLGHNIRSPFDTRYQQNFPWRQRFPEGPAIYERYFRLLRAHRGNFAEIWFAAWSLGLEWTPLREGYHGIGQFNLLHAWQMDRVVEEAERNGIYLNLVVHNHGKFSDWSDAEWEDNPFNAARGGYLQTPDDFFTDPRARRDFLRLMRYKIARWGYSPHVFTWELWSELDLTGSRDRQPRPHLRPETVEWHRDVIRAIREMDIYGRMVSTHVCGDYTHQNPRLIELPEVDWAGIDAYHSNADPLHIVELLRRSAEFNNPFNKPALVTEFGGSPSGMQGLRHVTDAFFAAHWASATLPLGGGPLFWWWQMVEEEGLFGVYEAVARFLEGEDRRDPELRAAPLEARSGGGEVAVIGMASPARALGWIYRTRDFSETDPDGPAVTRGVRLRVPGLRDGDYVVEFWNTQTGRRFEETAAASAGGWLEAPVPAFARDLAFKVRAAASAPAPAPAVGAR